MAAILLIVHVLSGIFAVVGVVGRQFARILAQQQQALQPFLLATEIAGRFENVFARPASLIVVLSGLVLSVWQGWPLFGFLQGSSTNWLLVSLLLVISVALLIIFVFIPRGKVYEQRLVEAKAVGRITPELRDTFDDPVVKWAHRWEEFAILAVIVLMIAKPF